MPIQASHKPKIKATARVLVYGEGKTPGKDEPDEIKEGAEHVLQYEPSLDRWRDEKTGRFIKNFLKEKIHGFNSRGV